MPICRVARATQKPAPPARQLRFPCETVEGTLCKVLSLPEKVYPIDAVIAYVPEVLKTLKICSFLNYKESLILERGMGGVKAHLRCCAQVTCLNTTLGWTGGFMPAEILCLQLTSSSQENNVWDVICRTHEQRPMPPIVR